MLNAFLGCSHIRICNMTEPKIPIKLTNIAGIIHATPYVLRSMLAGIDEVILRWHPDQGVWCINESIGHLIEADEHAFAARIESMLQVEHPEIPRWNANAAATRRQDCNRNTFELLDELAANRQEYARFISQLGPEQLARTGTYRRYGEFRISDFVYEWAYHDHSHLMQISDNIRAYIWPNFAGPMQTALSE